MPHERDVTIQDGLSRALDALRAGNNGAAVKTLHGLSQAHPHEPDIWALLGVSLGQTGQPRRGLRAIDQALRIRPGHQDALFYRAGLEIALGVPDRALASLDGVLEVNPRHLKALRTKASLELERGRPEAALPALERLTRELPDDLQAQLDRGQALLRLRRSDEALECANTALAAHPGSSAARVQRVLAFCQLEDIPAVTADLNRLLADGEADIGVLTTASAAARECGFPDSALAWAVRACDLAPGDIRGRTARAAAGLALGKRAAGEHDLAKALQADGRAVRALLWPVAEPEGFDTPAENLADRLLIDTHGQWRARCDWSRIEESDAILARLCRADGSGSGQPPIPPFTALLLSPDPAIHFTVSEQWTRYIEHDCGPGLPSLGEAGLDGGTRRLRVGYISPDFRSHAVTDLIKEVFRHHDRRRYAIHAYSLTKQRDAVTAEIAADAERFQDLSALADRDAAGRIQRDGIDILVDLGGYSRGARPRILALRPAPVQVNYLGFPASMAASWIDYKIGNAVLLPYDDDPFITEAPVRLPGPHIPLGGYQETGESAPPRTHHGLPEEGFVFCCFHRNEKIEPSIFDAWMGLLKKTPDAVLWLLTTGIPSRTNLRRHAAERGIDPDRLIFCTKASPQEHIARQRQADLFLDTRIYSGYTTVTMALWAGLPVVSIAGPCYAARCGTAALQAAGLSELIASDLQEYTRIALELAGDRSRLAALKDHLRSNRGRLPLFDAKRTVRHLEHGYDLMWERSRTGGAPCAIDVPADDGAAMPTCRP